MQMTQNLISPWDEMIPFHSYWCVTKFKIVQEMSRLSLHLLNFITQTLISLLNETSWTCCRVSEQSAWRVLLWGQVAACIVTGSIGFRCSQWSQVNGHAYLLHNPPTDEQTRRDLTDQSRRTSNFQSTEESFSQSPDLPGTENTAERDSVHFDRGLRALCDCGFLLISFFLVPTLFSNLYLISFPGQPQ